MQVLEQTIVKGTASELFLAAHLQDKANMKAVIDLLIETLDQIVLQDVQEKRKACMAALFRITGQRLQFDEKKWQEWWTLNNKEFKPGQLHPDY